ncbi:hypothetical protein JCM24511_08726 [Saitozyma sp. JCM 24511]|nr:hypothetical protein JCM24511_08726 [Saitozyma sp. JCM 24511]
MALDAEPIAGPSTAPLVPGPSAYHESSQFRHWRYSPAQLDKIRGELNQKSVEVVARNQELEKEAQISLGHEFTAPPPASTYLSVTDELLLLHFYISQASKICRGGFGLPEVVESTAISYLKRFYLKNSVMEWHPKVIMPTCLFLAAKTTNYPVPIDVFVQKIAKLQPSDVLDTEFLVAQSLAFEFWVRGAEKALRGWGLEFQEQPTLNLDLLQQSLPAASAHLSASRGTDAEFLYSPSQIALACWYRASPGLVEGFLEWRYGSYRPSGDTQGIGGETRNGIDSAGQSGTSTPVPIPQEEQNEDTKMVDEQNREKIVYGMEKERLLQVVAEITALIDRVEEVEIKKVKEVDKRLKACTNPEKVVGTAL